MPCRKRGLGQGEQDRGGMVARCRPDPADSTVARAADAGDQDLGPSLVPKILLDLGVTCMPSRPEVVQEPHEREIIERRPWRPQGWRLNQRRCSRDVLARQIGSPSGLHGHGVLTRCWRRLPLLEALAACLGVERDDLGAIGTSQILVISRPRRAVAFPLASRWMVVSRRTDRAQSLRGCRDVAVSRKNFIAGSPKGSKP